MAVYKIPQDVEADDKFVGPLSFKQFIFVGIAVVSAYLSFLSLTKGFWPGAVVLFPFILVGGFLGFPWGRDQPTEIWLAARIRFFIKPRVRIWNQAGAKELVTITAPKKIEKTYTNGLDQNEVSSRLSGLATLLDSRGWAVKNMPTNVYSSPVTGQYDSGDRLLDMSAMPQQVTDNVAGADILDETSNTTAINFDQMIKTSEEKHRQDIMQRMQSVREQPQAQQQPAQQNADFWFLQQGGAGAPAQAQPMQQPQVQQQTPMPQYTTFQAPSVVAPQSGPVAPTPQMTAPVNPSSDEAALLERLHQQQSQSIQQYGHLKTIQPLGDAAPTPTQPQPALQDYSTATPNQQTLQPYTPPAPAPVAPTPQMTAPVNPAIINLANNDDLNIETLARQANKKQDTLDDGEVVISLH